MDQRDMGDECSCQREEIPPALRARLEAMASRWLRHDPRSTMNLYFSEEILWSPDLQRYDRGALWDAWDEICDQARGKDVA